MGRESGAPWGVTPSPPTPGPPGLADARAEGPAVPPTAPLFLFSSPPLPPPPVPVLFARPVLVCHDDNKWMLMEAAVAVGPLRAPPLPPPSAGTPGLQERGRAPPDSCHGEGGWDGDISLPSSPPSSSSSPLLAEI